MIFSKTFFKNILIFETFLGDFVAEFFKEFHDEFFDALMDNFIFENFRKCLRKHKSKLNIMIFWRFLLNNFLNNCVTFLPNFS